MVTLKDVIKAPCVDCRMQILPQKVLMQYKVECGLKYLWLYVAVRDVECPQFLYQH